jgi:hypothetical protein
LFECKGVIFRAWSLHFGRGEVWCCTMWPPWYVPLNSVQWIIVTSGNRQKHDQNDDSWWYKVDPGIALFRVFQGGPETRQREASKLE